MKRNLRTSLLALALAMITAVAFAQDGPPMGGPDGRGAPQAGMRGPRMAPRGAMLLKNAKVMKELKITPEQKRQIAKVLAQKQNNRPDDDEDQGGPPDRPRDGDGSRPDQDRAERGIDAKLKTILTKAQYTRFREIQLQVEGPMALTRPDVARRVGLTDDQTEEIQTILEENRPQRPEGQGDGEGPGGGPPPRGNGNEGGGPPRGGDGMGQGGPPPGGGMGMDAKARKKVEKKILAVLTEEQRVKWTRLCGPAFKLKTNR